MAHESTETTHFSVVDAEGNAVSSTYTLNGLFGSGVTAGPLGFLLNDEMDDFTSAPGAPNMVGLIQGPANAIAPGKRPLSNMTPTIVLKDGKLLLVLGSPGGSTTNICPTCCKLKSPSHSPSSMRSHPRATRSAAPTKPTRRTPASGAIAR
jgi:gamma-glutamyltranspeptidase